MSALRDGLTDQELRERFVADADVKTSAELEALYGRRPWHFLGEGGHQVRNYSQFGPVQYETGPGDVQFFDQGDGMMSYRLSVAHTRRANRGEGEQPEHPVTGLLVLHAVDAKGQRTGARRTVYVDANVAPMTGRRAQARATGSILYHDTT